MRLLAVAVILAASLSVHADILYLRDGSRHYGALVSRDERRVVFRVTVPGGASSIVVRFATDLVERIEYTTLPPPDNDRESEPAAAADVNSDYSAMLDKAMAAIDAGQLDDAVSLLQKIVLNAGKLTLADLDDHVRQRRGTGLDEMLADTRLRAALADRGGVFRIRYATHFEAAALSRLLAQRIDLLLSRSYADRTLAQWVNAADEYRRLQPDARMMVDDARAAAAMLGVRLKYDPELKSDRDERRRLNQLRDNLTRFVAHVAAMSGYTALGARDDPRDPAAQAARRLAERQAAAARAAASQPVSTQPAHNESEENPPPAEKGDPDPLKPPKDLDL